MKIFYFLMCFTLSFALPNIGKSQALKQKEELSIQIEKADASGEKSSDGYIKLKITGGQEPYSVHIYSTALGSSKSSKKDLKLNNLSPGAYLFIVQDNEKTIRQETVTISIRK